jgi:hypothetical protein
MSVVFVGVWCQVCLQGISICIDLDKNIDFFATEIFCYS